MTNPPVKFAAYPRGTHLASGSSYGTVAKLEALHGALIDLRGLEFLVLVEAVTFEGIVSTVHDLGTGTELKKYFLLAMYFAYLCIACFFSLRASRRYAFGFGKPQRSQAISTVLILTAMAPPLGIFLFVVMEISIRKELKRYGAFTGPFGNKKGVLSVINERRLAETEPPQQTWIEPPSDVSAYISAFNSEN